MWSGYEINVNKIIGKPAKKKKNSENKWKMHTIHTIELSSERYINFPQLSIVSRTPFASFIFFK